MEHHPSEATNRPGDEVAGTPAVVIAGGGLGAVEAALALRAFLGERVALELVAPDDELVYEPLTVLEPFGHGARHRLPLANLARTHGVRHHRTAVTEVDPAARRVSLGEGESLVYEALIVATGARGEPWLDGAVIFGGAEDVDAYRRLLGRIEDGEVRHLLFAAETGSTWPLALYDLALLTAAWAGEREIAAPRLTIATPEDEPLALFGPAASRAAREVLAERGIEVATAARAVVGAEGAIELGGGRTLRPDAVVTLPRLRGNPVAGLPADEHGFLPTDDDGAVEGLSGVYAVGDATRYPTKQGGLATQQADAAASAIATRLGAPVEPVAFEPVLQGLLLTGVTAVYLRTGDRRDPADDATVAYGPLWWPPTKVAGRFLGPYLAEQQDMLGEPELEEPGPWLLGDAQRSRDRLRRQALDLAHLDAEWGDYASALDWLETVEWLEGQLSAEHAALRAEWEKATGGS